MKAESSKDVASGCLVRLGAVTEAVIFVIPGPLKAASNPSSTPVASKSTQRSLLLVTKQSMINSELDTTLVTRKALPSNPQFLAQSFQRSARTLFRVCRDRSMSSMMSGSFQVDLVVFASIYCVYGISLSPLFSIA